MSPVLKWSLHSFPILKSHGCIKDYTLGYSVWEDQISQKCHAIPSELSNDFKAIMVKYHWYHRGRALRWREWKYPSRCRESICPGTREDFPVLSGKALQDLAQLLTLSNAFILNNCVFRTTVALHFPRKLGWMSFRRGTGECSFIH